MREAILDATSHAGQPRGLADKLISWFDALSSGNETLTTKDAVTTRVQLLYSLAQEGGFEEGEDGE
jgi:hypothetical protein